jgi:hypothetical protein
LDEWDARAIILERLFDMVRHSTVRQQAKMVQLDGANCLRIDLGKKDCRTEFGGCWLFGYKVRLGISAHLVAKYARYIYKYHAQGH